MFIYIPLYLFCFVSTHFAECFKIRYQEEKKKKDLIYFLILVFAIFFALTFISVTRYGIGIDYFFSDNTQLNNMKDGLEPIYSEPLTLVIAKFVVNFNLPNQVYFVIFGFITNACFIAAIFINKDNKFLLRMFVLLCYCLYISSFNQVRQGAGIAIGMLGLSILINYYGKWYSFLLAYLLSFVSMLFHSSEIINIVLVTVYILMKQFGNKIKMTTVLVTCFTILALSPILLIVLKYTIEYIPFLNKYANYILGVDTSAEPIWKILGSIFMYIVPMFTLIMILLNFSKSEEYQMKLIVVYLFCNLCFMIISTLLSNLMTADRLRTMIYGTELFIFPYLFDKFKNKGKQTFVYQTFAMLLMICITLGTFSVGKMYPYRSIFFEGILIY